MRNNRSNRVLLTLRIFTVILTAALLMSSVCYAADSPADPEAAPQPAAGEMVQEESDTPPAETDEDQAQNPAADTAAPDAAAQEETTAAPASEEAPAAVPEEPQTQPAEETPAAFPAESVFYPASAPQTEVRGMWISYGDFGPLGLKDKSEAQYRTNLRKVLNEAKKYGINTIYFHARAFDDASWKSDYFKASSFLSSNAANGACAADVYTYDPLAVAIEETHAAGMSFHAWMNPYRINSNYFYYPASTVVTTRILRAVTELLAYDIDGIHFDDYFYNAGRAYKIPGDPTEYKAPGAATRRSNVNKMIALVYARVHTKEGVVFGVSPQGNYENSMASGADLTTWLSTPGYIDYLVPQLYWTDQWGSAGTTTMFSNRLATFRNANKLDLPMYIGLALYRTGYAQADDRGWGWRSDNLSTQVTKLRNAGMDGFVLFSAEYLYESRCSAELANLKELLYPTRTTMILGGNQITVKSVVNTANRLPAKARPYQLKITARADKNMLLEWTDCKKLGADIDGYIVLRRAGNASGYTEYTRTAATRNYYSDSKVSPNTNYAYIVLGYKKNSDGTITLSSDSMSVVAIRCDSTRINPHEQPARTVPAALKGKWGMPVINKKTAAISRGGTVKLSLTYPKGSFSTWTRWRSDNTAIARVDSTGKVTGVGKGTVLISGRTPNGRDIRCTVTVR